MYSFNTILHQFVHLSNIFITLLVLGFCASCAQPNLNQVDDPRLIFKIKLDPNQDRLNNAAQPQALPQGHAGQSPLFSGLSAHKIELVPNVLTPIYGGQLVYTGKETQQGGDRAIDFDQAMVVKNGEVFVSVPLKDIAPSTYPHIRISISYQNYDVLFNVNNIPNPLGGSLSLNQQRGTVASFVGFNTYINDLKPKEMNRSIAANKRQGFWAFETNLRSPYESFNNIYMGNASSTTVVNTLNATTPILAGSCIVTGSFDSNAPLVITGNETEDIVVSLSFSTNNSFEWIDTNGNGELDLDAQSGTMETIVDMGLRGLQPEIE